MWGRDAVNEEDLSLAKRFVRSSAPGQRGRVLLALFEGANEAVLISKATGQSYAVVRRTLEDLSGVEVVRESGRRRTEGRGQPAITWDLMEPEPDPERLALDVEEGV
jgi:ActR/RegA family two-component response regulator